MRLKTHLPVWHWGIEVTPTWVLKQKQNPSPVLKHFRNRRVCLTYLPKNDESKVLESCKFLSKNCGANTVVHIPARKFHDKQHITSFLSDMDNFGHSKDVFVIGGDDDPVGEFHNSIDILKVLPFDKLGSVGVAAYPDGHPLIDDKILADVLESKIDLVPANQLYIVTQLGISVNPILQWAKSLNNSNLAKVPLYIGVFGPTCVKKMLKLGQRLGFSKGLKADLKRITKEECLGHSSEQLLRELVSSKELRKYCDIEGFQISTFDEVEASVDWVSEQEKKLKQYFDKD